MHACVCVKSILIIIFYSNNNYIDDNYRCQTLHEMHVSIMQSKNSTSGVQLKPIASNSRFSKHNHSTVQDEAIKVDDTVSESGLEMSYIAELLENDQNWHTNVIFNDHWMNDASYSQENLEARLIA